MRTRERATGRKKRLEAASKEGKVPTTSGNRRIKTSAPAYTMPSVTQEVKKRARKRMKGAK